MRTNGLNFLTSNIISKKLYRSGLAILTTFIITSCTSSGPAPVVDLNQIEFSPSYQQSQQQHQSTKTHQVKPGETLFSIAWRYSLDHKQLAKINKITKNRIYPGQTLQLHKDDSKPFDSARLIAAINKDVLHKKAPVSYPASSSQPEKTRSKTIKPSQKASVVAASKKSSKQAKPSVSKNNVKNKVYAASNPTVNRWIWPVDGKIIDGFSQQSNKNKGLDISGTKGTPVRATAKGRVVYSGSGLRGYGQLVIIKHNENYISAYAHNDKIHVKENEYVKAGQRIADLGSSGANREKLHFEIRYKGKPVDPLNYLPKTGHL